MSLLKAGVGRADITPALGTPLMGYAPMRPAENILDNLTVTALALEAGDTRSLLLSITTTVIDYEITFAIRDAVKAATGYDTYEINVCAWQIHSGPATQTCWGWGDANRDFCYGILAPRCAEAAVAAIADLGDVEVGVGITQSDVGCNRRQVFEDGSVGLGQNPWGAYDPTMTAIRFMRDGKPYANIIHYGAHPTAIGKTPDVTRDWPGIMVDRVESVIGGTTLYLNGAVGDVGPRPGEGTTTSNVEGMREVGYRAAADAIRACRSVKQFAPTDLEVIIEDIAIPYRPLADRATAAANMEEAAKHRGPGLGEAEYVYWQKVMEEYDNNRVTSCGTHRQTITRIGNVAIVPFPGEPFAEIVLRLRNYSPIQHTLSTSTSNGSIGYIATRDSLHRGGYEVEVAKAFSPYILAENIDDVIIAENLRLLRKLKA
ncbi:MAG: hypothetical protein E7487_07705 [Ruminococcaceae bacterium]|nr:hypothetical protein [Oscillospiraceae bacterium]